MLVPDTEHSEVDINSVHGVDDAEPIALDDALGDALGLTTAEDVASWDGRAVKLDDTEADCVAGIVEEGKTETLIVIVSDWVCVLVALTEELSVNAGVGVSEDVKTGDTVIDGLPDDVAAEVCVLDGDNVTVGTGVGVDDGAAYDN